MKVASWNVNSLRVRLPQVLDWLQTHTPDVLALQETKLTDALFPSAELEAAGYYACFAGQKTYNGVALITRAPVRETLTDIPGLDDPQRRILAATVDTPLGAVRLLDLYVPNGAEVGSEKYAYKLEWLARVTDYVREQLQKYPHLLVLGDFNIAPDERDVHDPRLWEGRILFSGPERDALQRLLQTGLTDTFRLFEQPAGRFSWWDYRMNGFKRNLGLRIDLILASPALAERCRAADIDSAPRAWPRPSDHAPVLATFDPG